MPYGVNINQLNLALYFIDDEKPNTSSGWVLVWCFICKSSYCNYTPNNPPTATRDLSHILLTLLYQRLILVHVPSLYPTGDLCVGDGDIWNKEGEQPCQAKTQYLHFRFHANCFFLPWNIHVEISAHSMPLQNYRPYLPYQTLCTNCLLPQ